ncbi:MAG: DHH family phosphoesterase, partial [Pseudomonadota bacterium]
LLKDWLARPTTISIIVHRNPDGDALGSGLALSLYLKSKGHGVNVILPSEYPAIFEYLPEITDALIYDLAEERVMEVINNSEIVFFLDFNSLDRLEKMGPKLLDIDKKKTVMVDHHLDPEPIADIIISNTSASSTCEMIYQFIIELGDQQRIDINIGTCLFTGLITDTGSFQYATNAYTYEVASNLKAIGVDDYVLHDNIFNSWTEKQMTLLGHCLRNRMEIIPEYGAGILPYIASPVETIDSLQSNIEQHSAHVEEAGLPPVEVVPIMRTIFVSEDEDRIQAVRQTLESETVGRFRESNANLDDWAIVGTPEVVTHQLQRYSERLGMNYVIARGRISGVESDEQIHSHQLLARLIQA